MMGALWRRAAPGLLFAGLVVVVFADPLFTGRSFSGRDLVPYNLPLEKTIHSAYASGHLPVWSPFISGGRPLLPNPNAGALYPVRPLLSRIPFEAAMRVYPVFHWIAAGIGLFCLLRSLGLGRAGAWIGAVTYVFSGVSLSETFYPHILPGFMLMPWILWAFRRDARTGVRGALLLGTFFGLDFLAGDVFTSGLAIAVCLLWLATEVPPEQAGSWLLRLGVGVVLGGLLAAPLIVATALWIPETNRSVLGMKIGEATLFSVSPARLLEFIIPYPFGATWELRPTASVWGAKIFNGKSLGLFSTLYLGALGPIAAVSLLRNKRRSRGLVFARWLLGFGLAASVIPSLFPASWKAMSSPLPLRNPEKLVIAVVLAFAIFAARGFEEFRERTLSRRAALGVGAVLALGAAAAAAWPGPIGQWAANALGNASYHAAVAAAQLPASLSEAGLLWMATVVGLEIARSRRWGAREAAVLLLTLVPILANRRLVEVSHPADVFAPTPFALRVRRADPGGAFRVLGEQMYRGQSANNKRGKDIAAVEQPQRDLVYYTSTFWGIGTVLNEDFDSGDLARVESLRTISMVAAGYQDSQAFFGNLSLRWGIRNAASLPVSAYRRFGGDSVQSWDELPVAFPDVRLATRWREEPGPLQALRILPSIGPGELVVESGLKGAGTARPGVVRILEKRAGRLRLVCQSPDPTWLFVLREFWTHRTVEIDGREVEAVPAYLAFSAVKIPAGVHRLDWREEIPGIRVSVWGPVAFALIALFALFGLSGPRRPPPEPLASPSPEQRLT